VIVIEGKQCLEMGFWKKLLFWRRKRNVAVTTSDTAPQTSDVKEVGAEEYKITSDLRRKQKTLSKIWGRNG